MLSQRSESYSEKIEIKEMISSVSISISVRAIHISSIEKYIEVCCAIDLSQSRRIVDCLLTNIACTFSVL